MSFGYVAGSSGNTTVSVPAGVRMGMLNVVGGTFTIGETGAAPGATAVGPATPGFSRDYWPFGMFGPINVVLGAGVSSFYLDWL